MNLPKVITDLVKAQDDFDSVSYANCFSDTAVVLTKEKRTMEERKYNIGSKMQTIVTNRL